MITMARVNISLWVMGLAFTIIIGLAGIVYSSLNERINLKADQDIVIYMQKDLSEIKQGVNRLVENQVWERRQKYGH